MEATGKELGNGGMVLLQGYDMVNQWSFAGDADGNEETIRCERRWGDVGMMGCNGEHGDAKNIAKMNLS